MVQNWKEGKTEADRNVVGAVTYMRLKGLLQPVRRPDGQIGYGLTDEAREMLKAINSEKGSDNDHGPK